MKISKYTDSINIVLNFNNKKSSIITKKYKTLYYIKDKIYQLFYPIKSDIILKYNNRDLSRFLDQSIGLIFENKGKVMLQIEQIMGSKRPIVRKIKVNSQKNLFNEDSEINKQQAPLSNNRYKSIKTESVPKIYLKSFSVSMAKKKLPPIKLKNKSKIDFLSCKKCIECLANETKYYCKKCNLFTCSICKNKKHKSHLILEIDIKNEKANVDKYKQEIINNLCISIKNLDNLDNIQSSQIIVEEWEKRYNEAINRLAHIAEEKKEELKNNKNNNKESNKAKNDEFLKKIEDEKQLINNIVISSNKDPFQLFNDINRRERIINQTLKRKKSKINKIEDMFVNIENEIDNIMFDLEEQIN